MAANAVVNLSYTSPAGTVGSFVVHQGDIHLIPAGSTISVSLANPLDIASWQLTFSSDNAKLNALSVQGYPAGAIVFTLPLALSIVGMTVVAAANNGGTHKVVSTLVYTVEGDLDYGQVAAGKWTVTGIQQIPVPVPSGVKTVLEFNAGSFTWATVAGVFTPGADLTGTSTQQWIDAISGSGGTGGAVPIQNNAIITVGSGSTSDIDLSNAAAANGTLKALRLLAPSLDTATAGALNIGTTNVTSMQIGSAANTTGSVIITVNAAGLIKHMSNASLVLQQSRASSDFVLVGPSLGKAVNLIATGLTFGPNVVGPNINVQTMAIDGPPISLTISGQAANNASTGANVNGGGVVIKGGAPLTAGSVGQRGGVQLLTATQIMAEVAEVAPGQHVVALASRSATGVSASNVPASGGDGVVFLSNAASNPSASPVGGVVMFANAGDLWIQSSSGNNFQVKAVTGLGPSPTWANDLATSVTAGPQWVANISGPSGLGANVAVGDGVHQTNLVGRQATTYTTSAGDALYDSAANVNVGTVGATAIQVGRSGTGTRVTGSLTQGTGLVNLTANAASKITSTAGDFLYDSFANANLGTVGATAIAIGRSGTGTTVTGSLTQGTGLVNLTANAASKITTTAGDFLYGAFANVNLGTDTATAVFIGSAVNATAVTLKTTATGTIAAQVNTVTMLSIGNVAGDYIALGNVSAASGHLRVDKAGAILAARNSANTGDVIVLNIVGTDNIVLDAGANNLGIGTVTATSINIGRSGVTTKVTGSLTQLTGAVNILANATSIITSGAGDFVYDGFANVNVGTVSATAIAVGRSGTGTTVTGSLTQGTGLVNLTANAASKTTTTAGDWLYDSFANVNVGTVGATSIFVGRSGTGTTVTGSLTQGTGAVNLFANAASQLITTAGAITIDPFTTLALGTTNATGITLGSVANTTANIVATTNAAGKFAVVCNVQTVLSLGANNTSDIIIVGTTATGTSTTIAAASLTYAASAAGIISISNRSTDTNPLTLTIAGSGANNAAVTNPNGGIVLIQSGAATSQGVTGIQGAIRLQLGRTTTETMIECAEPALNQRVVALARVGAGITATQIVASSGDGIVWIGNAQTNPTANTVSGASLWASGATLWASKGFSVAPAGTAIWDAGTTTANVITFAGLQQGSSVANIPYGYVSGAAINVNVNIALTNVQYSAPLILLKGTVPVGNCQVTCPNVVGSTWLFDLQSVTLSATNNIIFICGSAATPAFVNTASLITSQKLVRMTCTAPNVISYG